MFNFSEKPEMQDRPDMRPRVTASFSSSSAGSLDPGPPVPRGVNDDNGSDEEEVQGEVFPTAAVAPEVRTPYDASVRTAFCADPF